MATFEERVTQDGKKRVRVKVRLRGYPTETATFERLTDARDWATRTEAAIKEGRYFKQSEAKKHTLSELIKRYNKEIIPQKKRGQDQKQQLTWWDEQIGSYRLADVTPALIVEHRDKMKDGGRSPATVNRYLAVLSHAFTVAMKEWEWVDENPFRKVSKLTEPRGRIRFLSDTERANLLKACQESTNPDLYAVVMLALSTGARKMEIWGMKWDQVDLGREVIVLYDTKNGETRVLPLKGKALELMQEKMLARRLDTDLVFPGQNPQKPMDFRSAWRWAVKKAKIKDFRYHDLRHSAASYLAMNGATLAEIAEILGHKTLQMVKRYSHLSEAHTASIVEKMNKKVFGG